MILLLVLVGCGVVFWLLFGAAIHGVKPPTDGDL